MKQPVHFVAQSGDPQANLRITLLPVLEDNFIFIVSNLKTRQAVVVDPAEALPVINFLAKENLELVAILNTHHHFDHVGGNRELKTQWPMVKIFGSAQDSTRIPSLTHGLADQEIFSILGQKFLVLETFGHTIGHITFVMNPESRQPDAFVGDTLFGGGCGKLFEGSFEQMLASLRKIRALPEETRIWCAHEYTEKNLWVACQLEPENLELKKKYQIVKKMRQENVFTVPLQLAEEKLFNPFLRYDCENLKSATQAKTDLETFTFVRKFRDQF